MKHSASALIAAARREAPRKSLEGEILGALGASTAVALAPSFGAKLWVALKHAAVSKVGIATIAFTAATGGYAAGRLQERAIHEATIAAPAPTHALTPTRTLTPVPTPTPTLTHAPTLAKIEETKSVTVTSTSTSTITEAKPVTPPPSTSLADEVVAIKRARTALLDKDARAALSALDDYDRAHPNGVMSEESLALRVRADRLAGDDVGAAEALTKLEQRFPESVQLAALRSAR